MVPSGRDLAVRVGLRPAVGVEHAAGDDDRMIGAVIERVASQSGSCRYQVRRAGPVELDVCLAAMEVLVYAVACANSLKRSTVLRGAAALNSRLEPDCDPRAVGASRASSRIGHPAQRVALDTQGLSTSGRRPLVGLGGRRSSTMNRRRSRIEWLGSSPPRRAR